MPSFELFAKQIHLLSSMLEADAYVQVQDSSAKDILYRVLLPSTPFTNMEATQKKSRNVLMPTKIRFLSGLGKGQNRP